MSIPKDLAALVEVTVKENKEIEVSAAQLDKVHVVLSEDRREIWLYEFAGHPRIIIKEDVPREVILAIITLKAAKKPFGLLVLDIRGESAKLGHLVTW